MHINLMPYIALGHGWLALFAVVSATSELRNEPRSAASDIQHKIFTIDTLKKILDYKKHGIPRGGENNGYQKYECELWPHDYMQKVLGTNFMQSGGLTSERLVNAGRFFLEQYKGEKDFQYNPGDSKQGYEVFCFLDGLGINIKGFRNAPGQYCRDRNGYPASPNDAGVTCNDEGGRIVSLSKTQIGAMIIEMSDYLRFEEQYMAGQDIGITERPCNASNLANSTESKPPYIVMRTGFSKDNWMVEISPSDCALSNGNRNATTWLEKEDAPNKPGNYTSSLTTSRSTEGSVTTLSSKTVASASSITTSAEQSPTRIDDQSATTFRRSTASTTSSQVRGSSLNTQIISASSRINTPVQPDPTTSSATKASVASS